MNLFKHTVSYIVLASFSQIMAEEVSNNLPVDTNNQVSSNSSGSSPLSEKKGIPTEKPSLALSNQKDELGIPLSLLDTIKPDDQVAFHPEDIVIPPMRQEAQQSLSSPDIGSASELSGTVRVNMSDEKSSTNAVSINLVTPSVVATSSGEPHEDNISVVQPRLENQINSPSQETDASQQPSKTTEQKAEQAASQEPLIVQADIHTLPQNDEKNQNAPKAEEHNATETVMSALRNAEQLRLDAEKAMQLALTLMQQSREADQKAQELLAQNQQPETPKQQLAGASEVNEGAGEEKTQLVSPLPSQPSLSSSNDHSNIVLEDD